MTIRVLIVDDSRFICKRIKQILEEENDFKVVGIAVNGKEGVDMAATLEPDVITMDVEMPVMDGITAVKQIMAGSPTPVLMFSATTQVGAKATLDALSAGAIDFLPKQLDEIDKDQDTAKRLLRRRVRMVAMQAAKIKRQPKKLGSNVRDYSSASALRQATAVRPRTAKNYQLLVIAASTGGPVAIQKALTKIPQNCNLPIIIVQHMPTNFTKSFAERLNQLCKIHVKEAEDGDLLRPGLALIGPGGMQMEITGTRSQHRVRLREKKAGEIYSPCADITLTSIAQYYTGNVLAVVMTGMGSDGKEGVAKLKRGGANIWAQDEASCTIYGMPKAVVDANLADHVYSLDEIANEFQKIR